MCHMVTNILCLFVPEIQILKAKRVFIFLAFPFIFTGCLMPSLLLSSTLMMGSGTTGALSLSTMAAVTKLTANPKLLWDLLLPLDMGPNGIHPSILKEMTDIITRPLNYFSVVLGIWRSPVNWRLARTCLNFQEGYERKCQ